MARTSLVVANQRRRATVARYAERRAALKAQIRSAEPGSDALADAVRALSRLPRDASPVRIRRRDQLDGRPRGHLRRTGTSRVRFRQQAHRGELPGITKARW